MTDVTEAVEEAVAEVEDRPGRDPETGRFLPGNTAALKDGRRSETLWSALADARAELVERVRSDLALNGSGAETLRGLISAYAEARLLRQSLFARMSEMGGPVTTKGNTRAIFSSFLSALDRERRLAKDLGLERRERAVDPVEAIRRAVEEANE